MKQPRKRPVLTPERIFLPAVPHPKGKVFIKTPRLGMRNKRANALSPAKPHHLDYIREHMPDIAKKAGI